VGIAYVLTDYTISSSLAQRDPCMAYLMLSFGAFLIFFILVATICVFLLVPFMEVGEEDEEGSA